MRLYPLLVLFVVGPFVGVAGREFVLVEVELALVLARGGADFPFFAERDQFFFRPSSTAQDPSLSSKALLVGRAASVADDGCGHTGSVR